MLNLRELNRVVHWRITRRGKAHRKDWSAHRIDAENLLSVLTARIAFEVASTITPLRLSAILPHRAGLACRAGVQVPHGATS